MTETMSSPRRSKSPTLEKWSHLKPDGTRGDAFERLNLHSTWVRPDGDWRLYLDADGTVAALPSSWNGKGTYRENGKRATISRARLQQLCGAKNLPGIFKESFGQALRPGDLTVLFQDLVTPPSPRERAERRRTVGSRAAVDAQIAELAVVRGSDVQARRIPPKLAEAGWQVDPRYSRGGINDSYRLASPEGDLFYVKREESAVAARAEVLVSALQVSMGLPGVQARTRFGGDETTIISPALGTSVIQDVGGFGQWFALNPNETPLSIRARRAGVLKRVTLRDLNLEDDLEVARFITLNAILGNTDRHMDNLNYGWRSTHESAYGGFGVLLPLDHGRTCFANKGEDSDRIAGTPAEAVTGAISNPHQLLRPFAELNRRRARDTRVAVRRAPATVASLAKSFLADDSWAACTGELAAIRDRAQALAEDPESFISEVTAVVVQ